MLFFFFTFNQTLGRIVKYIFLNRKAMRVYQDCFPSFYEYYLPLKFIGIDGIFMRERIVKNTVALNKLKCRL